MNNVSHALMCPFCGSLPDLRKLPDGLYYAQCSVKSCAGQGTFIETSIWNKRAHTDGWNYQSAYAQFEASLKAEREKNIALTGLAATLLEEIVKVTSTSGRVSNGWTEVYKWSISQVHPWRVVGRTLLALKDYIENKENQ